MAWKGRKREEGSGHYIRRRATAWTFAKRNLVPNSVADTTQVNTASNPAPPTGNGRIKDDLIAEWWFDEGSGASVLDRSFSTTTTDLSLAGGYVWKTDASLSDRNYLSMSATDAQAFNTNPLEFETDSFSGLTLEAWVRPTNAAGLNPGPGRIISFSKSTGGATNFQNFMLGHGTWSSAGYAATNYHARVQVGTETGFDEESIQVWTGDGTALAQLQHVVMTVEYANLEVTVKTYVDGDLKSTSTVGDFGTPLFGCWDDNYTLKIGYDTVGSNVDERSFDGDLFLVAAYSRALTLSEINQNRSEGVVSVTDSYTGGSRLFINEEDLSPTVAYNQVKDITVEASGTRASNINLTVGASSVSGTYGTDFVIDDTTKRILKNEYTQTFELSTSPSLSADIPIEFYIQSATGGNVIQSPGVNIDSYSLTALCNQVEPSSNGFIKYGGGYNYQLPLGNNQVASLGRCLLERQYDEDVVFTVSGAGSTSGTYAIKDFNNVYHPLPASAMVRVPVGQASESVDVSCQPEAGVIFPDGDSLTFNILQVSSGSNSSMAINSVASTVTVSSYNPSVDTGAMPTSSNTGCRINHGNLSGYTDLLTPDSGGSYVLDDSNVPESGLVIQGMMVSGGTIKINTDRPIKFVDCVWSGNLSALPSNPSYAVQSMTAPSAGQNLEFEYCTFSGMYNSCHLFTRFKRLHRSAFNWMVADFIKLKSNEGTYTVTENWFGPNINQKSDAVLNGNNGMWSESDLQDNGGWLSTTPHSDMFQQSHGHAVETFIFRGNNVESHSDRYDDGTVPPDHGGGNQCNAFWIIKGNGTYTHNFTVENNWFHGGANGWFTFNTQDQAWTYLNFTLKNNYIGGRGDTYGRINTGIPQNAPTGFQLNKVVEGNKWMFHDVETVTLPQEAIDLGTRTQTLNATTLNVNDLLDGVDFLKLSKPGLNESSRMNWLSRATPV